MTNVICKIGDAPTPKGTAPVLRLGSPFQMTLQPGKQQSVRTGVSFDAPVLVVAWDTLLKGGVNLLNNATIVPAGQEVVAFFEAASFASPAFIERGDSLLQVVLLTTDVDVNIVP